MSESTEIKAGGLNASLRVIIIDDESDQIPTVLGITPEREEELNDLVISTYEIEDSTVTDNFVEISKQCKHANELAYAIFHLGAHIGKKRVITEFAKHGLSSILEGLGSKKHKSEEDSDETND
jgi:hypothetical protein